mmetsp:Transcript_54731/g.146516  ORF Transcript_54731/g.146516 Transcript_54731/m.146516 type:complete len:88 (+) Transcript_54731:126-389(+)
MRSSSAFCTTRSLSLSSALVASSRSSTAGSRTMARAMAMRCFCPPLIMTPRSPTSVLYLSGNPWMKLWALAALAAASTSRLEDPSRP